ncbi:MAG TPA: AraC family transcriptional regulator [Burkholderiaceae bacterium]|jgi:AraC family transcriptional regulator
MNLCVGQRLDNISWTGLPLGRFAPPGHGPSLPVAAAQDTVFVWRNGASAARVRSRRKVIHYARHEGVVDIMAADEEAFISHDDPETPGECLLVAIPPELREQWGSLRARRDDLPSRFGFIDPHLTELATALERQCLAGEPYGRLYTESLSLALVAYAVAKYADPDPKGSAAAVTMAGRFTSAQQNRLHRFVEENIGAGLSLVELAKVVNYSPQHFSRLFRSSFGTSPHRYVLQLRIEHAKRMLRADHHSLSEIAAACGFADHSHFSTAFARGAGVSPGRYRGLAGSSGKAR